MIQSINIPTDQIGLSSIVSMAHGDGQLVTMLKNRDEKGFAHLYRNYSSAMFSVILNIVHDRDVATDVLQDLFAKLYNNIENYDPIKKTFHGWMLTVARNLAIDTTLSKGYRDNQRINDGLKPFQDSVKLCTEQSTDHIGVIKLLQGLKPKYRELIELEYIKGYSKHEISELLGIPLGTVKTRIGAGLVKLRAIA